MRSNQGGQGRDPRQAGARPEMPPQAQEPDGAEHDMSPRPDLGVDSYVGHGRLKGRVALITGGDSGIRRAVGLAFVREGADVAFAYHQNDEDADETRQILEAEGGKVAVFKGDVGDPEFCAAIVRQTVDKLGQLDILVNNAAYQGKELERFEDLDAERVLHTFRTNVVAMFNIVRESLPHLKAGASIINVTSIQASNPSPSIIDYASTKGAISNFTMALAEMLGPRGIRVNAVAPGPIWTPLPVQSFSKEKNKSFGSNTPLGRAGQPREVAPAFVFLASDEASYVSGEILGVTGGRPL